MSKKNTTSCFFFQNYSYPNVTILLLPLWALTFLRKEHKNEILWKKSSNLPWGSSVPLGSPPHSQEHNNLLQPSSGQTQSIKMCSTARCSQATGHPYYTGDRRQHIFHLRLQDKYLTKPSFSKQTIFLYLRFIFSDVVSESNKIRQGTEDYSSSCRNSSLSNTPSSIIPTLATIFKSFFH